MRFRLPLAVLLACMAGAATPALAQDDAGAKPPPQEDSGAKHRLDLALTVLRDHQNDAGKSCLDAMTRVHQTEDQVSSLGQADSNSNRPDNGADVARDVLDSDYETAEGACRPDAMRVCSAHPQEKACATLTMGGGNGPHGP